MTIDHAFAMIALAPTFTKGVLVVISAFVLFIGTPYLMVSAVFGLRLGYLVTATALFAWLIILSSMWAFGFYAQGPGTPKYLGPRGTEGHWQVIAATTTANASTKYPETTKFPGPPWKIPPPNTGPATSIPAVTTAFQVYLANQATEELAKQGQHTLIDPTTFTIQNVAFTTSGHTSLAAGQAFFSSGGPEITVFAYHDSGNVQSWSFGFLVASVLGFAIHLPFLDRAEKRRKDILTGGTAPAWYGPA